MIRRPPKPRRAAQFELARALLTVGCLPLRLLAFSLTRASWRRRLARHIGDPPPPLESPPLPTRGTSRTRPLRVFISAGETSSAGHAARVAEALRAACDRSGYPPPHLTGLGPSVLSESGVACVGDPCSAATMGGQGVWREIPFYLDLLERAAESFSVEPPDVLVAVDAPALHLPIARMARRYGIPCVHMVAPQYWAWGPWRVRAYRKVVQRALTIFPWEPGWFAELAVPTAHVGHPQMDVLAGLPKAHPINSTDQRTELVLLPGSRRGEVAAHLGFMLEAAEPLLHEDPDLVITIAQASEEHRELIESVLADSPLSARLEVGELHSSLNRARTALAASGTVLTDLLHHRLPTVVIYALRGRMRSRLVPALLTTPFFATTNLLAQREVLPERGLRAGTNDALGEVRGLLHRAHHDEEWRQRTIQHLGEAAERIGPAGAASRCAAHVIEMALGGGLPL